MIRCNRKTENCLRPFKTVFRRLLIVVNNGSKFGQSQQTKITPRANENSGKNMRPLPSAGKTTAGFWFRLLIGWKKLFVCFDWLEQLQSLANKFEKKTHNCSWKSVESDKSDRLKRKRKLMSLPSHCCHFVVVWYGLDELHSIKNSFAEVKILRSNKTWLEKV